MAGTAFQLFEEPEKVGEQTPNILQATLPGLSGTFLELYKRSCCDIFSTATLSFSTAIVEAVIVATAVAAYVALLSLLLSSSLL